MYDTILVPHGGTKAGDEALRHAIHIAKLDSSKIIILNVIEPWPEQNLEYWNVENDSTKKQVEVILSNMKDGVRKFLAEQVAQCRKEGLKCEGIF